MGENKKNIAAYDNKRRLGADVETMAVEYLISQGAEILDRNFRCRQGEIDIICRHNGYLVFVEVKFRASMRKGAPEEAVGIAKQRVICRVADYYRCIRGIGQSAPVRYDVIAVLGEELSWYQNAFVHRYR